MWKPALGIAAVIVVIAMSGCGASVEAGAARTAAPVETSAPVLTAAPASPVEEEFLTATQRIAGLSDVTLSDALAVGNDVCAQLDAGVDPLTMTPVGNGDEAVNEEMVIVSALTLCTEHNDSVQQLFIDRRVKANEAALNG